MWGPGIRFTSLYRSAAPASLNLPTKGICFVFAVALAFLFVIPEGNLLVYVPCPIHNGPKSWKCDNAQPQPVYHSTIMFLRPNHAWALALLLLACAPFAQAKKKPALPEIFSTAQTVFIESKGGDITNLSLDRD